MHEKHQHHHNKQLNNHPLKTDLKNKDTISRISTISNGLSGYENMGSQSKRQLLLHQNLGYDKSKHENNSGYIYNFNNNMKTNNKLLNHMVSNGTIFQYNHTISLLNISASNVLTAIYASISLTTKLAVNYITRKLLTDQDLNRNDIQGKINTHRQS